MAQRIAKLLTDNRILALSKNVLLVHKRSRSEAITVGAGKRNRDKPCVSAAFYTFLLRSLRAVILIWLSEVP